jgi:hypothetical protein
MIWVYQLIIVVNISVIISGAVRAMFTEPTTLVYEFFSPGYSPLDNNRMPVFDCLV